MTLTIFSPKKIRKTMNKNNLWRDLTWHATVWHYFQRIRGNVERKETKLHFKWITFLHIINLSISSDAMMIYVRFFYKCHTYFWACQHHHQQLNHKIIVTRSTNVQFRFRKIEQRNCTWRQIESHDKKYITYYHYNEIVMWLNV